MPLPNLLLVGVQKSGTTWLHQALSASDHIYGSEPKELNFWGKADSLDRLVEYSARFHPEAKPRATYLLESTPHYFHAPNIFVDIAQQIRDGLPDVRPMVILRNPIDRYRSAYIHHIQKGRLAYVEEIDALTDAQIMLATGLYGKILSHWRDVFPHIIVLNFDALQKDHAGFLQHVFRALEIPCDIDLHAAATAIHTSADKRRQKNWPDMPRLTDRLREALKEYYREDNRVLQSLVDFDVSTWCA